jgi:hypothetical protein
MFNKAFTLKKCSTMPSIYKKNYIQNINHLVQNNEKDDSNFFLGAPHMQNHETRE